VDIFNTTNRQWTTAALSVATDGHAATSLPNQGLAIFAGGWGASNAVDIFDATSGRWTTAALSVGRAYLGATSLPNPGLAIFAGGWTGGTFVFLFFELLMLQDGVMWESGGMCCVE
jgi:hypothetical protein